MSKTHALAEPGTTHCRIRRRVAQIAGREAVLTKMRLVYYLARSSEEATCVSCRFALFQHRILGIERDRPTPPARKRV